LETLGERCACDVLVTEGLLQFWVGDELLKTVARTSKGAVRKLHDDGGAVAGLLRLGEA
jgi:hypothetical protein